MNFIVKNNEKILIINDQWIETKDPEINLDFVTTSNFYIVDLCQKNYDLKITLKNHKKVNFKVCFYLFNNQNSKEIKINIFQKNNTKTECNIYAYATGGCNSKIQVNNYAKSKQIGIKSCQNIIGNIFDSNSTIEVIPAVYSWTNKINSSHGVKIGQLDKEKMFYLNTRNLSKKISSRILLESQLSEIKQEGNNQLKLIYKQLLNLIEKFVNY